MTSVTQMLLSYFEEHGGILWEVDREGEVAWVICPCCGKRDLRIVFDPTDETEAEGIIVVL